jgi:hypothetical protein
MRLALIRQSAIASVWRTSREITDKGAGNSILAVCRVCAAIEFFASPSDKPQAQVQTATMEFPAPLSAISRLVLQTWLSHSGVSRSSNEAEPLAVTVGPGDGS